jgi:exosome complex component CSL4
MTSTPAQFPTEGTLVYPGDKLGSFDVDKHQLSTGVHRIEDLIYSSVLGVITITAPGPGDLAQLTEDFKTANTVMTLTVAEEEAEKICQEKLLEENRAKIASQLPKSIISVVPLKSQTDLPKPTDVVICRVTEIMSSQAIVEIQFIDGCSTPCTKCRGVIRARDVRAIDPDGVLIYDSFRPGDILKAAVISIGDARSYYLSTARSSLGVVHAEYIEGVAMQLLPVSPEAKNPLVQYLKCPLTGSIQPRKAALPDSE